MYRCRNVKKRNDNYLVFSHSIFTSPDEDFQLNKNSSVMIIFRAKIILIKYFCIHTKDWNQNALENKVIIKHMYFFRFYLFYVYIYIYIYSPCKYRALGCDVINSGFFFFSSSNKRLLFTHTHTPSHTLTPPHIFIYLLIYISGLCKCRTLNYFATNWAYFFFFFSLNCLFLFTPHIYIYSCLFNVLSVFSLFFLSVRDSSICLCLPNACGRLSRQIFFFPPNLPQFRSLLCLAFKLEPKR